MGNLYESTFCTKLLNLCAIHLPLWGMTGLNLQKASNECNFYDSNNVPIECYGNSDMWKFWYCKYEPKLIHAPSKYQPGLLNSVMLTHTRGEEKWKQSTSAWRTVGSPLALLLEDSVGIHLELAQSDGLQLIEVDFDFVRTRVLKARLARTDDMHYAAELVAYKQIENIRENCERMLPCRASRPNSNPCWAKYVALEK